MNRIQFSLRRCIEIGSKTYLDLGYSPTIRTAFKTVTTKFVDFLEMNQLQFSNDAYNLWAIDNREQLPYLKTQNNFFSIINDIFINGHSTILKDHKDRFCYNYLNSSYQQIINNYASTLSYKEPYLSHVKYHCSQFLRYLETVDVNEVQSITHNNISDYIKNDNRKLFKRYRQHIIDFLNYFYGLKYITNSALIRFTDILNPKKSQKLLSGSEREKIILDVNNDRNISDINEFDNISLQYSDYLNLNGYSKRECLHSDHIINEFRNFIIKNDLSFTESVASYWIESVRPHCEKSKFYCLRRTILSLCSIRNKTGIKNQYLNEKNCNLPKWSYEELQEYILFRERELVSPSTIASIKSSCSRFLKFLEINKINNWQNITPEIIKNFHNSDYHSTPQALSMYMSKIKGFLQFIADKSLIAPSLILSIPRTHAPKCRIVRVLSEEHTNQIYHYRNNADTPIKLRDSAILMCGLTLGLRCSDIVNLSMDDISWNDATLSIIQKKTRKHLILPLTVEAGNSLWKYIREGRPRTNNSTKIFIKHCPPFNGLHTTACREALTRATGNPPVTNFHILRKTFASRLLSTGSNPELISLTLGHTDTSQLNVYLSTDIECMRKCALEINELGLEYFGTFNL